MFRNRSYQKELLDERDIPSEDLYQNLKELNIINRFLGGYRMTFNALQKVLDKETPVVLVDIGSGGGDTLRHIQKWNKRRGFKLNLYGIDQKQVCIDYSREKNNSEITFICDDYKNVFNHVSRVHILHACLFCHHLSEAEIIDLIGFCRENNTTVIINDLERNAFAYYAIKVLTFVLSKSYLVKNDAPLSVLRGFKIKEWEHILKQANATKYSILYKWAFRHEIIVHAER